jgi:hypothetical protein
MSWDKKKILKVQVQSQDLNLKKTNISPLSSSSFPQVSYPKYTPCLLTGVGGLYMPNQALTSDEVTTMILP